VTDRQAEVFMRMDGQDLLVGQLYAHDRRGAQSATFRYADSWLSDGRGFAIDPALDLYSGPLQTPQTHQLSDGTRLRA
jgi:serine/threonine-protein kinase HipA